MKVAEAIKILGEAPKNKTKNFNFQFRSHRSVVFASFVQTDATLLVIVDQANVGSVCTALASNIDVCWGHANIRHGHLEHYSRLSQY